MTSYQCGAEAAVNDVFLNSLLLGASASYVSFPKYTLFRFVVKYSLVLHIGLRTVGGWLTSYPCALKGEVLAAATLWKIICLSSLRCRKMRYARADRAAAHQLALEDLIFLASVEGRACLSCRP